MDTLQELKTFTALLRQLSDVIKETTCLENQKAEAAARKEHHKIDRILKEEQACMLRIRSLEQRRIKSARSLGWEGLTFRQILKNVSETENHLLFPYFTDLDDSLNQFKAARISAIQALNLRLHELELLLCKGDTFPETGIPQPHLHDIYI